MGKRIDSGSVFINRVSAPPSELPCGGVKNSGYGRDCGRQGLEEFANIKTYLIGPDN